MIKRWTTTNDFITYGKTAPDNTVVETEGMSSVGDGGALKLYRTGNTGTPSQDFVTRGNNTCIDASGTEWEIIEGTVVTYDGTTDWFNNGFGSTGVGNYVLTGSTWVKAIVDTDLTPIESDINTINSSITSIESDVTDINNTLLDKADYADLTKAQEELLPTGSKVYPDDGSYLANGMTVTAGTTHLRVLIGGMGKIYQVSLNGGQADSSGAVSLLDVDSRSVTIGGVEYYLEDTYYPIGDSRRYINQPDTGSDNTPLIQQMNDYLKGVDINISLIGSFRIGSSLNIYNNFDMSQAEILFDNGQFIISDDRSLIERELTITESGIDFTKTIEGFGYLPVTNTALYDEWENSIVKIRSEEVDLYRYDGGVSQPQTKGTITHLDRFGRLSNGLNHTYASGNNVTITLYRMTSWLTVVWSKNIQWISRTGGVLKVERNNTIVDKYYAPEGIPLVSNFAGAVFVENCGMVVFRNAFSSNTGETSGEGATPSQGYDFIARDAYDILFDNCQGLVGWANFDANYTRKVTIKGGNWYSIVGHYGCADYLVTDNATILKNYTVGTGAFDSTVKAENTNIVNGQVGISTRNDYTELKGDLILKDVRLLIDPNTAELPFSSLFNIFDGAIIPNNTNIQPRRLELPDIYGENIRIISKDTSVTAECELVYARNQEYSGTDEISAPKNITLKNIRGEGVKLKLNLFPYGSNQQTQMSINIDDVKSDVGPVEVATGNNNLAAGGGTDAKINMDIENSIFKSAPFPFGLFGDVNSELTISRSKIINDLNQFSGGALFDGVFSIDNSTVELDGDYGGTWSMQGSVTKASNLVFDGRKYLAANSVKPNVSSLVMNASGNVAIDCNSTHSSITPQPSGFISPCPQAGEQGNF